MVDGPLRQTAAAEPSTITADAGYWDTLSLRMLRQRNSDAGIARFQTTASDAELAPSAPHNKEARAMRELLATETGKALYAMRKAVVEPVYSGQIKRPVVSAAFAFADSSALAGANGS